MNNNKKCPTVFDKINGYITITLSAPVEFKNFKFKSGDIIYIDHNNVWHLKEK